MKSPNPIPLEIDAGWTAKDPTEVGTYVWRKNYQWQEVTREVRRNLEGVLVTYAHRYEQWLPLNRIGGEWKISETPATPEVVNFIKKVLP
jgi:hypothetical protein